MQTRYLERDRLELQEIRRRIPPPMQQYYLQVDARQTVCKHGTTSDAEWLLLQKCWSQLGMVVQMTVGRRSEVPKAPSREGSSLAEPGAGRGLAAWRAARGFKPPPLAGTHGCVGRPTFTPLPGRCRTHFNSTV
jgi:hypothetical protein